ncbi:MAG: methanethiol S-methyltransferase, partial [Xanthobacteraceae bacterium]
MSRIIALLYGIVCYAITVATLLYAIGFVENLPVPKSIDTGETASLLVAIAVNLVVMSIFAIQHSVMARKGFKNWWTQFVPASIERSTYCLFASLSLILLFWQWVPLPAVVWQIHDSQIAMAVMAISFLGWVIVFTSTFLINHFEL